MIQANLDYPEIKLFIYMDSDAVVGKKFSSSPVNDMLEVMQSALNWDPEQKPMVFNQVSQYQDCLISIERTSSAMICHTPTHLQHRSLCYNVGTCTLYTSKAKPFNRSIADEMNLHDDGVLNIYNDYVL